MKRIIISFAVVLAFLFSAVGTFAGMRSLGDVNSDGVVNSKDAYIIKRNVADKIYAYDRSGDIFFDGKVNMKDCFMLKAYFAGVLDIRDFDRRAYLITDDYMAEDVRNAVNSLIISEGADGEFFDDHSYTVTDLDGEKMTDDYKAFMLERMAFPFTQREINAAAYDIMTCFGEGSEIYEECRTLRSNISSSFKNLRSRYGPFPVGGVSAEISEKMLADSDFQKFAVCIEKLSRIAEENGFEGMYFVGMTPHNVYETAVKCFDEYKGKGDSQVTFTYNGESVRFAVGDTGLSSLSTLMNTLSDDRIDTWIVSDAQTDVLCAALDSAKLHPYITGAVGDMYAVDNGIITCHRDSTSFARRTADASWTAERTPVPACMNDSGKITAFDTIGKYYYGKGASAIFTDTESSLTKAFSDTVFAVKTNLRDMKASCLLSIAGEGKISYPEYLKKTYTEPDENEKLSVSVMSLNIRCGDDEGGHSMSERRPRIRETVRDVSPDVIGLQEVTEEWLDYLYSDYGTEYEIYNLWRDTEEKESAPIMWKKDKLECLEKGAFWLSDSPEYMTNGYDPCRRICQFVKLRDIKTGKEFVMMNTHVGFIEDNQKKSCDVILDYAKKISGLPTFITGDFNFQPDTKGYNTMTAYFTDVNMATLGDTGETFHGYYHGYEPIEQVDYCFADGKITPRDSEIIRKTFDGKYISDHYALRFILEF